MDFDTQNHKMAVTHYWTVPGAVGPRGGGLVFGHLTRLKYSERGFFFTVERRVWHSSVSTE